MGSIGTNRRRVSVVVDESIAEMIARRAKAHGVTPSRYGAMVMERWRDNEYPAVSSVDETARSLVIQQIVDDRTKVLNPEYVAAHRHELETAHGAPKLKTGHPPVLRTDRDRVREKRAKKPA